MTREEAIKTIRLTCPKISDSECDFETAMRFLIPELAESEDERIREEIVDYFKKECECLLNDFRDKEDEKQLSFYNKAIAWLEKQKEKFEDISTVLLVKKEIGRRIETWQKSRKEALAMECNTLADDAAVRIEELNSLISFLGTIRCSTNEKQKEQKPIDPSDDELQRHQDELYNFKVFATKQAKEHHISFVHDFEWNNFCVELLSYFNEQKPAEWSEEDRHAIENCEYAIKEIFKDEQNPHRIGTLDWLKSLRPQPKQDKGPIAKFVQAVEDVEQYRKGYEEGLRDGMKRHWKPSEEQMEYLNDAIDNYRKEDNDEAVDVLKELRKQLKKLM